MKSIILIVLFIIYVALFIWVAYDMSKTRKKIDWVNLLGILFVPIVWPLIYFISKKSNSDK